MHAHARFCCFISLCFGVAFGEPTQPVRKPGQGAQTHTHFGSGSERTAAKSQPLAVTHVSLYKNGVGFFEHAMQVSGNQTVTLDLTSAQLNDVLQTLTAIDLGGGTLTGAGYNSTTPLEQQLRALPLSLGEEPTQEALFNSLRGARVEVSGSGPTFAGRILSLEVRPAATNGASSKPAPELRVLTVIADSGAARTLELTPGSVVRLLDTTLRADLNSYLALLDSNRSEGVRHLSLTDHGTGTRELRVSFLSEVPVWKSTYRLLITDRPEPSSAASKAGEQTGTLQGYSVIDNTTSEDWNGVQLSLIAGSPQSFLQPLAQPIYSRRQEIPIAANAQLTPQTHDSAIDPMKAPRDIKMIKEEGPPSAAGVAGMSGAGEGVAGGVFGAMGAGAPAPAVTGRNLAGGAYRSGGPARVNQNVTVNAPLMPYETIARNSTAPAVTTNAFDDFFAYNLTEPVSIPRNGSALVPILQAQLPTERVTLWSPSDAAPLRALWLTNSSALTLDRGSFSVVENGAFAGEGLLETIHPGERRLLSYAADQAVRVTVDSRHNNRRVTGVSVSKGVLHAENAEVADVDYTVSNAAPAARTVVLEEPRRQGWTLDAGTQAAETTPSVYRFRLAVPPRESARLHIAQRHTLEQLFRLTDATEDQLTVYLRDNGASPAVLQQLEPVFAAKRRLAVVNQQIEAKQKAVNQLGEDQKRLRDNLAVLKGSTEERSLMRRYTAELNTQEDALASLRRDLAALEQQRAAAEAELATTIDSLHITAVS